MSCDAFTVYVETVDGVVVWTAPLTRQFINQPLDNLLNWARARGGLKIERLP